jgi:transposase
MSDTTTPISLPKDVADCHALIEQLAETVNEQAEKIESLSREKEDWRLAYSAILQARFRRRAERYVQDPNQLKLDFGDTPEVADAAEGLHQAVAESEQGESEQAEQEQTVRAHTRRRRAKPRQEKLPEHLPRYKVDAAVPESLRQCPVHGEREVIGYDEVETLELKRPELRVRVTRYPKFACSGSAECGVGSPERPAGLVEGNRYDTSVAAEVITGKYGYHLPTYRQQDYFAGSGWAPSRSTLLNLLRAAGELIRPLAEHFKAAVLGDGILGTDDTPVTLLLPKEIPKPDADDPRSVRACEVMSKAIAAGKPSITARMWVYRSATVPLNVFDFTVSRHRDGPEEFLKNYRGKLMADCYSGYQAIAVASSGQIERGACAAHARRKVFETRQSHPLEASVVLAKFQQLYDIEDRAKTFSDQQRLALRQAEAVPVWASLGEWLRSKAANDVLPKSRFGEALGYLRNHFEPLQLYLTDGRMPIDNNDAEQLMKQVALGRKNWLFIGSLAAGVRAADLMTLVSSAVRNDLDVWAYVKDVLDRLLLGTTDLDSLRPDVWRCAHPEAIRQYRTIERRDRADRKQRRRARRRAHPRR